MLVTEKKEQVTPICVLTSFRRVVFPSWMIKEKIMLLESICPPPVFFFSLISVPAGYTGGFKAIKQILI